MDRNEAKLLLQACRPNSQDHTLPVFAEALLLAERDPELKKWWAAQQAFDQKISAKLQEIPLPSDLRAIILAGRKIEQLTPHFQLPHWLAIAAVVVFLLVAGFHHWGTPWVAGANTMASRDYDASILGYIAGNNPSLGLVEDNHDKVMAWLQERHAPTGTLPATMAAVPTLGCQQFDVHGHSVSLICFSVAAGKVAHLFIVEKQALTNPPGSSPEFDQSGAWSTASWSDSSKTYLLVTEAGPDLLKQLL